MRFMRFGKFFVSAVLSFLPFHEQAFAWQDLTHLAMAEAAGFRFWYSAAAPDVAKSKYQFKPVEDKNHFYNNTAMRPVNASMVMEQVARYNRPDDEEGHLYGAIIASVREYRKIRAMGKFAGYSLVFAAHYIGDLSMPLHNTPYDDFNKERHGRNDGLIESSVRNSIGYIQMAMTPTVVRSEFELARQIALLAESSRQLGLKMRRENRDMTVEEAYLQVSRSAVLLKAVLEYAENPQQGG